jgi:hypothetical protein
LLLLTILGCAGFAGWQFRTPLFAKINAATAAPTAPGANAADADAPLTATTDDASGIATTNGFEIADAGDDAALLDADVNDDGGDDDEEEDDDGGLIAMMRGDAAVAAYHAHPSTHVHPTKPIKKKKRKR